MTTAAPAFLHGSFRLREPLAFDAYVRRGEHRSVEGWVAPGALSALTLFNAFQQGCGIRGHMCEIGVHHGRFCIAMSLLRGFGERSLAIDVFDQQDLNVDQSGKGDFAIFSENVRNWLGTEPDLRILQGDSLTIAGADVVARLGGRVRLFSVDGSHTRHHTLNDMKIAEACLLDGGVVVVDDFLNPEWPGVAEAVLAYLTEADRPGKLQPIGYGDNKFYLSTRDFVDAYKDLLLRNRDVLSAFKAVQLCGRPLYSFSMPPADRMLAATPLGKGGVLTFEAGEIRPDWLVGSWSQPGNRGVWATGEWAGITLTLEPGDAGDAIRLALTLRGLCPALSTTVLDVFLFNTRLCEIALDGEPELRTVTLQLDRDRLGADGRAEVWFHNSRLFSPADLGISNDVRPLSFFVHSFERLT